MEKIESLAHKQWSEKIRDLIIAEEYPKLVKCLDELQGSYAVWYFIKGCEKANADPGKVARVFEALIVLQSAEAEWFRAKEGVKESIANGQRNPQASNS